MRGAIPYHLIFDLLAATAGFVTTLGVFVRHLRDARADLTRKITRGYAFALMGGAIVGGYVFGTINLKLSHMPGVGRSIVGAILGAIIAVELYKLRKGIGGSTGVLFVPGSPWPS